MKKTLYIPHEWIPQVGAKEFKDAILGVCDAVMPRMKSTLEEPDIPAHVEQLFDSCQVDAIDPIHMRNLFPVGPLARHLQLVDPDFYQEAVSLLFSEGLSRGVDRTALWAEFGGGSALAHLKSVPPPQPLADEIMAAVDDGMGSLVSELDLVGPIGSNSSAASVNYLFGGLGTGHIWAADRYNGDPPAQIPAAHKPKPQMRQMFVTMQSGPIGTSKVLRSIDVNEAAQICAVDDPQYPLGALLYFPDIASMMTCLKAWPETFA